MKKWTSNTRRFTRYTVVGISTFLVDLGLLFILIDCLKMDAVRATAVAFLLAVSINYFISRAWAFVGTERRLFLGYLFFLKFAIVGAVLTSSLMWLFTTYFVLHFLVARVLIAGMVGILNYLANLYFNFRVSDKEIE